MKTSFTSIAAILISASTVMGALSPQPTPHHHIKRQQWPDGVDISRLLADPSAYLENVSSVLKNGKNAEKYVAMWASATNQPEFQQSLSQALVSQFGTQTARAALAQYSSVVEENHSTSSAPVANQANAVQNNADANSNGQQSSVQQVSNRVTSGASSLASPATLTGLALAVVPAVLVAVL